MKTKNYRIKLKNRSSKKLRKDGGGIFDYFFPKTSLWQGKKDLYYNLKYNGTLLKCDVCGDTKFAHIDGAINPSKTFQIVGEVVADADSTVFEHPVIIHRCSTCSYCKIVYRTFGVKDEDRPIKEVLDSGSSTQPQPVPAAAPKPQQ